MTQDYELVVKGVRNFENKVAVTVALRDKKHFDGEIFDLDISLDRVDVAAGLCEGDEQSPEKRPIILEAQNVWITYKGKLPGRITGSLKTPPTALRSEKDDIESPIEKLEGSVADLNKKLSVLIPSEDEKKRRDEQFAAFYDYCIEVTRRNFVKIFEEGKSLQ